MAEVLERITAKTIVEVLTAWSSDAIWASELDFFTGKRRIDFWTMVPMKSRGFLATAYEIKVSREDFRRDNDEKQSGALAFSDRFYYVTPPDLLTKADLPAWAGLLECDGLRLTTIRRAPVRSKQEPTWEFIVSLMRNCGEARRDVGIIKSQLAYFQSREEAERRMSRMRSHWEIKQWREALEGPDTTEARGAANDAS
ncbi:MmcB family DNA repair protein [Shinella sp.]|uniref:MmcB family DNA repair protein n=1 Tax=Shinella sp. TaxID=1870904 RepID=UPI0028A90B22|nr:hypothetical protein [Shinella sp.]